MTAPFGVLFREGRGRRGVRRCAAIRGGGGILWGGAPFRRESVRGRSGFPNRKKTLRRSSFIGRENAFGRSSFIGRENALRRSGVLGRDAVFRSGRFVRCVWNGSV